MSDLSSVVSFFAAGPEELEISRILDLRGPGRLFSFTDRVSDGIEDEDGTEGNNPTLEPVSSVGLSGVAATFTAVLDAVGAAEGVVATGGHRGHFFASSESSGTSFTSLRDNL